MDALFAHRRAPVAEAEQEIGFFDPEYCSAIENFELCEVAPDIVLFNYEEAKKINKRLIGDFSWVKGRCFQIGQSGQGDCWLIDLNGWVNWFNHDKGEISPEGLLSFGIGFYDFLKMAVLVRNVEHSLDNDPDFFDKNINRTKYIQSMNSVKEGIYDLYPYKYF